MTNAAIETPQEDDDYGNIRDEEADSLRQMYSPDIFSYHHAWQIETVDALKGLMRDEENLIVPRTNAILTAEPQRAVQLMKHHTECASAQADRQRPP